MKYNETNRELPVILSIEASDGFKLGGYLWKNNNKKSEGLVIINPATSGLWKMLHVSVILQLVLHRN